MRFPLLCAVVALVCSSLGAEAVVTPPPFPEGQKILVDGAKLSYVSVGEGEPLVIISGGPGAAHYLYPFFNDLSSRYRVIYLDSYGTGFSDQAPDKTSYTFARHVDEIEGFRKALGLGKIHLLGHSYGSLVVQAYALKYPESLDHVVLVSPLTSAEAWQKGNAYILERIRHHYPEVAARIEILRAKGLKSSDPELVETLSAIPEDLYYYGNVKDAGHLNLMFNTDVMYALGGKDVDFTVGGEVATLDFRPQLKNLRAPLLILAGRYDYVVPPDCTLEFKKYAPQARFVMCEKSGHNLFLEENAFMLETLKAFLATPGVKN